MNMSTHAISRRFTGHPQDKTEAFRFIEGLTGSTESAVTFQTFGEGGPSEHPPTILHGTLHQHWERLVTLNNLGHGIFVMVNTGDGRGRSSKNVLALRALFTDDDTGDVPKPSTAPCEPSLVVKSAHGLHRYWVLQPGEPLSVFTSAQETLAGHFGTDSKVKDLPRVMRLPGFFHLKQRESPFFVAIEELRANRYTAAQVLSAYSSGLPPEGPSMPNNAAPSARTMSVAPALAVAEACRHRGPGAPQSPESPGTRGPSGGTEAHLLPASRRAAA